MARHPNRRPGPRAADSETSRRTMPVAALCAYAKCRAVLGMRTCSCRGVSCVTRSHEGYLLAAWRQATQRGGYRAQLGGGLRGCEAALGFARPHDAVAAHGQPGETASLLCSGRVVAFLEEACAYRALRNTPRCGAPTRGCIPPSWHRPEYSVLLVMVASLEGARMLTKYSYLEVVERLLAMHTRNLPLPIPAGSAVAHKLPNSCPTLVSQMLREPRFGPNSAKIHRSVRFWVIQACRSRPKIAHFRPTSHDLRQCLVDVVRNWRMVRQLRPFWVYA